MENERSNHRADFFNFPNQCYLGYSLEVQLEEGSGEFSGHLPFQKMYLLWLKTPLYNKNFFLVKKIVCITILKQDLLFIRPFFTLSFRGSSPG